MNKKLILKILLFLLVIMHIVYIIKFGTYIIKQTWYVRQNGEKYYLSSSFDDYKLTKISNSIFPEELSFKTINSSDYIDNLKSKSIDITLIYRIMLFIQIGIIVILIVIIKTVHKKS